jgi:hypothetical protein
MSDLQQQIKESITIDKDEIRLIKQEDGNWRGFTMRDTDLLMVREVDPQTCLVRLMTHP